MLADRSVLRDMGRLIFWYPLRWCVLALPFRAVLPLGAALGFLDRAFGRRRVRALTAGVTRVFPDPPRARRIVLGILRNHVCTALELIKFTQLNPRNLHVLAALEGRARLDEALASGRGVVLCTAHFGSKQVLQPVLGHLGYAVNQIHYYKPDAELTPIQSRIAQRHRRRIEARIPARFIPADGFLREAFRCLARNEVLIVTGDGSGVAAHIDGTYRSFPFLGASMLFPTGPFALAARTGAALVPVFVVRDRHRHRIVFEPPLALDPAAPHEAAGRFAALCEAAIRSRPELWEFWEEFGRGDLS